MPEQCLAARRPAQRLPARLPLGLRARSRAHRWEPDRAHSRGDGADLHGGRGVRQGRALCRAPASPGPPVAAVAPGRREGCGPRRLSADFLGRGARRGGRAADLRCAAPRRGDGMALLLCRDDGSGAARRHQPAAPCDALFARGFVDLQHAFRFRLARRGRGQARCRRPRDGEIGPDRRVGRQPGLDPNQCDDPCRRPRGASAVPSSSSSIPTAPRAPKPPICISHPCPAPMARSPARSCMCCSRRAMPTAITWPATPTTRPASKRISPPATRPGRRRSPDFRNRRSWISPGSTAAPGRAISVSATAFRARATARPSFSR